MPQIYEITARFRRQTQPVQYQAAESELVVKAQLSEAEYQAGDAAKLLHETKTTVLTALGLSAEATAPVVQVAGAAAGGGEAQPKPVTRKPKADKPVTTETATAPQAASAADMSSMDGTGQAAPSKPEGVSDEDLQKTASAASQRCGSAAKVKALMKEYGVARLGELPQEKRKAFIEACDGLKKDE